MTALVLLLARARADTLHEYDAAREEQTADAFRDTVAGRDWALRDAVLVDVADTATRLTRAYRLARAVTGAGGATAAFPLRDTTYEVWLRAGVLDEGHQVVFETGGGQNGVSILLSDGVLRVLVSQGDVRRVDLSVPIARLELADFLQVAVAMDVTAGRIEVSARDVVGEVESLDASATLGSGGNGASLFSWGSSLGTLGGSHINLGGRTEASGASPAGLTPFAGEIALLRVHDRALGPDELEALHSELTRPLPVILDFTATPAAIGAGEAVTLSWTVANASRVEIEPGVGDVSDRTTDGAGSMLVAPLASTVYEIRARDGVLVARRSVEVLVDGEAIVPRLTEVMARNGGTLEDGDGEEPDWIEIHNPGVSPLDLAGFHLSDDPLVPTRWTMPPIALGSDERLIVFASGREGEPFDAQGMPHASFRLDGDGGWVGLVAPDGVTVVSEIAYGEQREDVSFGPSDDTGDLRYFTTPTPGARNGGGVLGFVADTRFDVDRGFYDEPFSVSIETATPGATILYTLDGSAPSPASPDEPEHGARYTGPIEIRGTTVLRALAHLDGYEPTDVDTQTYVFLDEVIRQPSGPTGFPSSWAGQPADYEMDPDVVGEADLFGGVYRESIRGDLLSLPSLSIVMDRSDLFGARGLYDNPQGDGVAWERSASVELVDPAGEEAGFQVDCGIRIQGGSSRSPSFPKHSFRLLFKREHGPPKLRYPLFSNEPEGAAATDRFDTVVLRAHFNNSWAHWHYFQCPRAQYVRDQFLRDSQLAMGWASAHGRYVHLYINGLYWGLYNVCERPTAPFLAEYFGGEREDYDAQNVVQARDGDLSGWSELMALANAGVSSAAQYERVTELLDVANLADYMLLNFLFGNDDWDGHNWYAGRRRVGSPRYQLFCWDSELIISRHANPPPLPDFDVILGLDRTGLDGNDRPSRLHARLSANADYRMLFADRVQEHLFGDGALTVDGIVARWSARRDQVWRAVVAESARWGDFRRDVLQREGNPPDLYDLYHRDEHYVAHQEWLYGTYFPQRPAIVLDQLRARGLWPSLEPPRLSQDGGVIPLGGLLLVVEAAEGAEILYTLDGSDPRAPGGEVSASALAYSEPIRIDEATRMRARARSGATWSALREADFLVHRRARAGDLVISELHYHPAPLTSSEAELGLTVSDFEYLALTVVAEEPVELSGARLAGGVLFAFPTDRSVALVPGETVLVVRDLGGFVRRFGAGPQVVGVYEGKLSDRGERVALVDSSGELIDGFSYGDDGDWPREADGRGCSLLRLEGSELDPSDAGSWTAGAALAGDCQPLEEGGAQLPGDCTQDGRLDLSDGVCVLAALFLGDGTSAPCGDGSLTDPANVALVDWQPDGRVDLSDGVALLVHLFSGGPPHALGAECVSIVGCGGGPSCGR